MKIVLRSAHTHAGIDYKAGDTIDVPEADAAWIDANFPAPATPDAPFPPLVEHEPAKAVAKRGF